MLRAVSPYRWTLLLVLFAGMVLAGPAQARHPYYPHLPTRGSQTGLPLPRFAQLRAPIANLRRGPGLRYPILWVYRRRHLPVLITREFGNWRLLSFSDGTRGWMHRALIAGGRSFVVTAPHATLRARPRVHSAAVARFRHGVIGKLKRCLRRVLWCRVVSHGYSGFIRRAEIWGTNADARRWVIAARRLLRLQSIVHSRTTKRKTGR